VSVLLIQGDARKIPLADESIHCCVTSPPYWGLRDYGVAGQLGLEKTPEEYIAVMVDVFREVWRVLRDDGTLWLNMGDSYATQGGENTTPQTGPAFVNKLRGKEVICRSKRIPRIGKSQNKGNGSSDLPDAPHRSRWGGGNNPAAGLLKPKDLIGTPWTLALAMRADGWYLRCDIIWEKKNPMPESVKDRPTRAHEYIFLMTKSERYYYDADAIAEAVEGTAHTRGNGVNPKAMSPVSGWAYGAKSHRAIDHNRPAAHEGAGPKFKIKQNESFSAAINGLVEKRNKRTVWEVNPQPFPEAHFATFPEELIKPCILAGCPAGGWVLDPFIGSGTTALVARNLQCNAVGLELNPAYIEIAKKRLAQKVLAF
jgi:site-specific DNA-methyltransferase (cytosine-N4-specific)